ncbi:MAG TPA: MarR family winged helix-turn-helix transcriptional regulator [bacterium]
MSRRRFADVDNKMLVLLERLSRVFKTQLWEIAKKENLSPIQFQFLLYLQSHPFSQRIVSNIALEFGLTQATVSDAVKSLCRKNLVLKKALKRDARVAVLNLTPSGKRLGKRLSNWADIIKNQFKSFDSAEKELIMLFLMKFIKELHNVGIIPVVRMCITCNNFRKNVYITKDKPHYCTLTDSPVADYELKLDCPDYRMIKKS